MRTCLAFAFGGGRESKDRALRSLLHHAARLGGLLAFLCVMLCVCFVLCKSLFLLLRISLPFIAMDEEGSPLHLEEELTRGEFEGLCAKLLERLRDPVEKALKDADLSYKDLDEVVPLGPRPLPAFAISFCLSTSFELRFQGSWAAPRASAPSKSWSDRWWEAKS